MFRLSKRFGDYTKTNSINFLANEENRGNAETLDFLENEKIKVQTCRFSSHLSVHHSASERGCVLRLLFVSEVALF